VPFFIGHELLRIRCDLAVLPNRKDDESNLLKRVSAKAQAGREDLCGTSDSLVLKDGILVGLSR